MPELEIYYPSVVIKAFDSRGLGCFKYVGICIIPSINIFLEQLITEDDYEEQIYGTKKIFKPVKHLEEKPETVRKSLISSIHLKFERHEIFKIYTRQRRGGKFQIWNGKVRKNIIFRIEYFLEYCLLLCWYYFSQYVKYIQYSPSSIILTRLAV